MLESDLLHPEILQVLGSIGHSSKILIADGNFPFATKTNRHAHKVFLNLAPGVVGACDVLKAICSVVPIESAMVMSPPRAGEFAVPNPQIWDDFGGILAKVDFDRGLQKVGRFVFYDCCKSDDCHLVIATGEQKIFANLLLTIGVTK
ncbi:MAG: RbsD/FucU family protein [Pirellulaceae bacterium]|jgi:L-fucose mutarotase|nr:RbsD/FucU family protein [Pirellulaceae bacterium]